MPSSPGLTSHIIVLANEKGGTGKSTTAMHIIVSLMQRGFKIAVVDLDTRQKSLTRYLENRKVYADKHDLNLSQPNIYLVEKSDHRTVDTMEADERTRLNSLLSELDPDVDFILIDCPGSDSFLSRLAQSHANTLVTPLNDSFVDLDLLGQVDPETYQVKKLSFYSESVWESRKQRALSGRRSLDWVVLRNRMSGTDAYNKRRVNEALDQLQGRIAFRYIPGLNERVIYRELFPLGLTLADYKELKNPRKLSMSHVAARHEIRRLVGNLHLPGWDQYES